LAIYNTVLATINHIALPEQVQDAEVNELDSVAVKWPMLPVHIHVLDFKGVKKLHKAFYKVAARFKKEAESKNAKVISVNFRPEILEQVIQDGMENALGHSKNMTLAQHLHAHTASQDSLMQTRSWIVKYAVEAAREAMSIMFETTIAGDENYRETPKNISTSSFYKVAVVQGHSPKVKSTFRLYFERETLEALTRTVSPTPEILDEELLLSIPTELLNIIYTSVKSRMNDERGYDIPPGIPTLVDPKQLALEHSGFRDKSWIPLVSPLGPYYLQIELGA
jgi:hypothetical protein